MEDFFKKTAEISQAIYERCSKRVLQNKKKIRMSHQRIIYDNNPGEISREITGRRIRNSLEEYFKGTFNE